MQNPIVHALYALWAAAWLLLCGGHIHVDILGIGDSIASGSPAYFGPEDGGPDGNPISQCWPPMIAALADVNYRTYYNAGLCGDTIAGVNGRLGAMLRAHPATRVYVHDGQNDACVMMSSARFRAYLDSIKATCAAAGAELILDEILPNSPTPAICFWTKRLNCVLLQWAAANNVRVCVGMYSAMEDPGNHDHLLPVYDSGDGVHPSVAGYRAMGTALATVRVPVPSDIRPDWLAAAAAAF